MIHAYNEEFLPIIQTKLASVIELGVLTEKIEIDRFMELFLSSPVCLPLETANPIFALGKSANELLAVILNKEPTEIEESSYSSPEYWVGYVLAYAQWYFNKPFSELVAAYPCSKLIGNYFPYHETDITNCLELFRSRLNLECKLKTLRISKKLSQTQLSLLSGVPVRTIKAYEQGKLDICKAQAETLYALAKVLNCSIEDIFSRYVISYTILPTNDSALVANTFMDAYTKRNPPYGLIFHSDNGANFTATAIRALLKSYGIRQSFSRIATPQDNGHMESFFATLKKEELYRKTYHSPEDFFQSVKEYIEYYNNSRLHSRLGYKTPKEVLGEYDEKHK